MAENRVSFAATYSSLGTSGNDLKEKDNAETIEPMGLRPQSLSQQESGTRSTVRTLRRSKMGTAFRRTLPPIINRLQMRWPRTFSFFFVILLPLVLLILWAMFCGHFLALLERDSELVANNAFIASRYKEFWKSRQEVVEVTQDKYEECIDRYLDAVTTRTSGPLELKTYLRNCTSGGFLELDEIAKEGIMTVSDKDNVLLNWNTCAEDGVMKMFYEQVDYVVHQWLISFKSDYEKNIRNNELDHQAALSQASESATGTDSCKLHSAGGSIFWLIFMT